MEMMANSLFGFHIYIYIFFSFFETISEVLSMLPLSNGDEVVWI